MSKKLGMVLLGALSAFASVCADTYVWTNATGDGLYFTPGNWTLNGEVVTKTITRSPTYDILIDGDYTVTYVPGGDWSPTGTVTIKGGAKFCYNGTSWPNIKGTIIVDNAVADFVNNASNPGQTRVPGTLILRNGGQFLTKSLTSNPTVVVGINASFTYSDSMNATAAAKYSLDGGTLVIGKEYQPASGTDFSDAGTISCNLLAPQTADSVLTFEGTDLILRGSNYDGFYQSGATYIDVPSTSKSRFTIYTSAKTADDVYNRTFGSSTTTPKFRYNGEVITLEQFNSLFSVEEHAEEIDGSSNYADFYITKNAGATSSMAITDSSIAMGSADDTVVVNATFENLDDGAVLKLAYSTEGDLGRKIGNWGDNLIEVGDATDAGISNVSISGLPTSQLVSMRLFLVSEGTTVVSGSFALFTRYYGADGTVNEWLGTVSTSLSEAGNWSLGHVPTTSEIRWFGNNAVNGVEVSGAFTTIATDMFMGGTITMSGEFHPVSGTTLRGTAFSCKIMAPQNSGSVLTAKGGSMLVNDSGNSGFWAPGSSYMDIVSGSTARFTFPTDAATIYSWTFGANKFKYNGGKLTAVEFAELFTVEDYTYADGETTGVTFYLKPMSEAAASFADAGVTASRERGSTDVTFTANIATAGDPAATVTLYYGTANGGSTAANWENSVEMGTAADNTTLTSVVTLEENKNYYYAVCAANEAGNVWCAGASAMLVFDIPEAPVNTWLGTKSTDSRVAANWSLGHVPTAEESVAVYDTCADNDLHWYPETAAEVTGWEQTSYLGGSVFVKFFTTADTGLEVTGNVALNAGNWTHEGPAAEPSYMLNVKVDGNMTVGADAWVQAGTAQENNEKFRPRGYRQGPGYAARTNTTYDEEGGTNIVTTTYVGASYAGDGGHEPYTGSFVSYGSILDPMDWGSAGKGDSVDNYSGAGLVKLVVAGTLTVNGTIASHGFGWDTQSAAASGGTVNITAGSIAGSGTIEADGGRNFTASGSGGRVRVALTDESATFDAFGAPDHIHANPGNFTNLVQPEAADSVLGAAGTVTLVTAADIAAITAKLTPATVVVSDSLSNRRDATDATSLVSATHLPARLNAKENLKGTNWKLLNYGKLRLTANARIASLEIADTEKQRVFLDGYTLATVALTAAGNKIDSGSYTAAEINAKLGDGIEVFEGEGKVEVGKMGLSVIVK